MDAPVLVLDEHLQAAWRHVRANGWPDTLDEALQDPSRGPAVRAYAKVLARRATRPCAPEPRPAPRCAAPLPPLHSPPPGWVDHKRAAAGDRDD